MEFIVDNREDIKSYFIKKNYDWTKYENLKMGDFLINYNDKPICIFERKTIEDLASSIKDGRYREQKKRLIENYSKDKIIYIIEGDLTKNNKSFNFNKITKETIYSTIFNIYLRDKINILHTNNSDETIECLEFFCTKIKKKGIEFISEYKTEYKEDLVKTILHTKKDNTTPELVFISQLSCINGISPNTSKIIVNEYKTMKNLILQLESLTDEERKKKIANLTYLTETNKNRKLGPKFAEKLLINLGFN